MEEWGLDWDEDESQRELADYFSGKVVEARWTQSDNGVVMTAIRMQSDRGMSLGWMTSSVGFHCVNCLESWIAGEPHFLASDLGDIFLLEVQGLEARVE